MKNLIKALYDLTRELLAALYPPPAYEQDPATLPMNQPPTIPPKPPQLDVWARAIQAEESSKPPRPTDVNIRLKNPGNLKLTVYTQSLGGHKSGVPGLDGGTFCEFNTYQQGFMALKQFLTDACNNQLRAYKGTMTLRVFTKTYANPPSDEYAFNVAKKLGISVDTPIRDII